MRKHFLILMLMALLPLVGWAQTNISTYHIVLSAEVATYDGTNKMPTVTLVDGASTIESDEFVAKWYDGETEVTQLIAARPVTGYTVVVEADGTHTFSELPVNSKKFYIVKGTPTQTEAGVLYNHAYDGAEHALVTTPPVVTLGQAFVEYSLTPSVENSWSTAIPKATKVGDYDVYYRVPATDNYIAKASFKIGTAKITGTALEEGTDYIKPIALGADINFDNQNHALATAGEALTTNCTMKYSLDGINWDTNVPEAKNAATYTVYWKAEAIPGYYDANGDVTAKIVAAAPTVTPATATTATLTYTGLDQNLLSAPGGANLGATPVYTIAYKATEAGTYGSDGEPVAYNEVTGKNAGFYRITTKVVAGTNYVETSATPVVVVIGKAELTVKTANKTRAYGEANPALSYSYEGFVNGETAEVVTGTPALSTTAAVASPVGEYPITAADGGQTAANYKFTYVSGGKLTISQKELNNTNFTFTLHDASKVYTGEPLTTNIDVANYTPVGAMTFPTDYTYVITNNTDAGTANVIISGQGNFKGSVLKTFTITPKPVYVKPRNNSKAYGDADPSPLTSYDLVATPNGEPIAGATLNGTVDFDRIAGNNAGTYMIYVKSFTEGATANYTIATNENAGAGKGQILNHPETVSDYNLTSLFTVTSASSGLVLKFKDNIAAAKKTKVYGETNPVWGIEDLEIVDGLIPEDEGHEAAVLASLSAPTFELTSEKANDNNQVILTAGLLSANYTSAELLPMDFSVTQRPITVTVGNQGITYGATALEAAAATAGTNWFVTTGTLVTGDESLLGVSFKTENDLLTYAVSDVPYQVIDADIANTNYDVTVIKGNLTVSAGGSITLDREHDMDALIKAYHGKTISVTLDRNISRTEAWFAMVLPFPTTMTDLVEKFGYCVVNVLDESNMDASKVKFKLAFGDIAANQPFLIKLGTAISAPVDFGAKAITYAVDPVRTDVAGNKFHGVFKKPTTLTVSDPADSHYWMMISKDDKFKKVVADQEVTPINCYLETAQVLDAFAPSIFVEDMDGSVTAINVVNDDAMQQKAEGWYNLNGVKLQGVPTEKGVYINNGKKVVIK